MIVLAFSMTDKANQVKFFEKIFLMANISLKIVFEILVPILRGADIDSLDQELW